MVQNTIDKTPVVSYEKALLGYLIIHGKEVNTIRRYLEWEDFYDSRHQELFKVMVEVTEKPAVVELITITETLQANKLLSKVGGEEYLLDLVGEQCLRTNLTHFAKTISESAKTRNIRKALHEVSKAADRHGANQADILNKVEDKVFSVFRPTISRRAQPVGEILSRSVKLLEQRARGDFTHGIVSQFKNLDNLTGGFQNGDLIVLASRPSMGKTGFALNVAANIARTKKVAFFSLEMPGEQLVNRILSLRTGINSVVLRSPQRLKPREWNSIRDASKEIETYHLFIDDSPGLKLNEITWKIRQLSTSQNKPDIVFVDYMQLINVTSHHKESRQLEVTAVSRALKQIAREQNIPIVALAQLSRRVDQRESKIPIMSDLRESGSIEQDADLIMFLYRESYYKGHEEKTKAALTEKFEKIQVILAKHRNGPTGRCDLLFVQSTGRFADVANSSTPPSGFTFTN